MTKSDKMNCFGSDIMFEGANASFMGETKRAMPDVIFFKKHLIWGIENEEFFLSVDTVLNHEPIHQILWEYELDPNTAFDVVRNKFIEKHNQKQRRELYRIL